MYMYKIEPSIRLATPDPKWSQTYLNLSRSTNVIFTSAFTHLTYDAPFTLFQAAYISFILCNPAPLVILISSLKQ